MASDNQQVFLVKRTIPPQSTFLALAKCAEEIWSSLERRHQAPIPADGKINQLLGKSNRAILEESGMLGTGAEDYEIWRLAVKPSQMVVTMLNDDWGTATLELNGKKTEWPLLNLA